MFISNLSGNDIYCLQQKHYQPGAIVFGNCLYSSGFIESIGNASRLPLGEEIQNASKMLAEGRSNAFDRLLQQARMKSSHGIINVSNQLISYSGCMEIIATGTLINNDRANENFFSTHANGKDFFCLLDTSFIPVAFVFGNAVHATGMAMGLFKNLKSISRAEMPELAANLNASRKQALSRMLTQARDANAILGIKTFFSAIGDACEIALMGTAVKSSQLNSSQMISSNLTASETWSLAKTGYTPVQLVMHSVVFSLGLAMNVSTSVKALFRGENQDLSRVIFQYREKVLDALQTEATNAQATSVFGTKIYVLSWGNGLIELFAIGTAVKKSEPLKTSSEQLPPQAISLEENKFYNDTPITFTDKTNTPLSAMFRIFIIILIILALIGLALK